MFFISGLLSKFLSINVSVDASGSNVEGDEASGRELGMLISTAVQSEITKQKRPGGLLSAA